MWITVCLLFICLYLCISNRNHRLEIARLRLEIQNRWKLMDNNASQVNNTFKTVNAEIIKLSEKLLILEKTVDKNDIGVIVKRLEKKILQNTQNIQNVFKFRQSKSIFSRIPKRTGKRD